MKEDKSVKFANLLKKRNKLSAANKKNTKTVSANDPQLMDIINKFNESEEYKKIVKK
ncbi:MAG: hypothetical protein IJ068_06160 [Bacilli bacterium]|nr:hypothetical protein [Bacilli bacterium]